MLLCSFLPGTRKLEKKRKEKKKKSKMRENKEKGKKITLPLVLKFRVARLGKGRL